MTVADLILELSMMPQDDQVRLAGQNDHPLPITRIYHENAYSQPYVIIG